MQKNVENIINKALNLRPSDRAILAQKLINSLTPSEDEVEQEWLDIVNKRDVEIKEGKESLVNWEKIKDKIKKAR
jgi:putative addiction module component (TIGR02574 family)